MTRSRKPSHAIASAATIGTPLSIVLAYLAARYGVPAEVASAAAVLMASAVGYFTRGGRHGEPQ